MLYFQGGQVWKLTDFGISAQATSGTVSTEWSRGTQGYRAPELLQENAKFSNRVDMWALGSVVYELAVGTRVFSDDWAVGDHYRGSPIQIEVHMSSDFWRHHSTEVVKDLLNKEWNKRPRASEVSKQFSSYSHILNSSVSASLYNCACFPPYSEWKDIARSNPTEPELFLRLKDAFEAKGTEDVALALRTEMVRKYVVQPGGFSRLIGFKPPDVMTSARLWADVAKKLLIAGQEDEAIAVFKATLQYAPEKFILRTKLARIYMKKERYNEAILEYKAAIETRPTCFRLWKEFCDSYLAMGKIDDAIEACEKTAADNPASCLVLGNLYVAKRDFQRAIATQRLLFEGCNPNLADYVLSAFSATPEQLAVEDMCENELIKAVSER